MRNKLITNCQHCNKANRRKANYCARCGKGIIKSGRALKIVTTAVLWLTFVSMLGVIVRMAVMAFRL